jgi:signal transduction histidine kinase/DNA-binding response OmpR family regulator
MERSRGKLFRKYLLVLLLLIGGLLTVSSAVDLYFSYRENQRALVKVEREKAFAAAETIERFIQEIEHHVRSTTRAIADDPSVAAPRRRDAAYRETLASALAEQRELDFLRLLRNVPAITELRYIDVAGKEQIRVSRLALDAIGSGADFAGDLAYIGARSGNVYFSPVYFRHESEPFMTMAIPADASAFEVITAEVSLRAMWDVVSRIKVGSVGFAYVVDAQGNLIAHPDLRQVLKGRDLSALPQVRAALAERGAAGSGDAMVSATTGLQGGEVLTAHAPIATPGWAVFIEQPLAEAFAPLQATIVRSSVILGVGLVAAILASVLLARGMVAPIRKLRLGAERIGAGDLAHRIDVRTGDELEALGEEFNRTAARLQESHRNLEDKVAARTEELSRSVAEMQALGEVGQAVNSTLDLQTVLATIVTHAVRLSRADAGTIYVYDPSAEVFVPQANYGLSEEMVTALRDSHIRFGDTVVGRCAAERHPVQIPDLEHDQHYRLYDLLRSGGFRALIGIPLLREDRVLGALVIRRRDAGEFPAAVVRLLETFAAQSVLAIQNARLFQEIQDQSHELEAASRHKSQFLANMSHELRTPLNAIIGVSEMLLEDARDLGHDDQIEPLERILRAGRHLLALINEILDLSKIEAGKVELEIESFAVAPLVRDVASTLGPAAEKNGNRIEVRCADDLGTMSADETRIRQALLNLVSNAVKFTERGVVTITAGRENAEGREWIALRVADTGIGMTPEQMGRLFQDFTQADSSTTRKYGGTGLGLAISRRFCRMMGGDITVQSDPGHGSTFTIRLPAEVSDTVSATGATASPPSPAPTAPATATGVAPQVLVVDDDPTVRDLMARHLAKEGFAVLTAVDGIDGLEQARRLHPAAITLDVSMPGIDGWTVLAALKGDPTLADIPVVLVTIIEDKQRGYALGATDYLVKPVDRRRLVDLLRTLCGVAIGRVLLVEDDEATRATIRQMLEREGWEVVEAENGRVALERVAARLPDAIVLDLLMPEMDGFEFVAELRRRAEWRKLPVLVVTAKDLSDEDHRRLNGDVERVIRKSGQPRDELLNEVGAALAAFLARRTTTAPVAQGET